MYFISSLKGEWALTLIRAATFLRLICVICEHGVCEWENHEWKGAVGRGWAA